jgi:hypothetical protein
MISKKVKTSVRGDLNTGISARVHTLFSLIEAELWRGHTYLHDVNILFTGQQREE